MITSENLRERLPGFGTVTTLVAEGKKKIELHVHIRGCGPELIMVHNFWLYDETGRFVSAERTIEAARLKWDSIVI